MRYLILMTLALSLMGCSSFANLDAKMAAPYMDCPVEQIQTTTLRSSLGDAFSRPLTERHNGVVSRGEFIAIGCGHRFICKMMLNRGETSTQIDCRETVYNRTMPTNNPARRVQQSAPPAPSPTDTANARARCTDEVGAAWQKCMEGD